MGMSMIMSIIMGIVMTTILGASIGPNVVEQMKIKKVENKTIGNQVVIKDAIERYIVMTGEYPKDFDDLKSQELLKGYHEDNLFGGGYSFLINEEKGTLTIYTKFDDDKAGNYFKNSFKTPNTPTCVEKIGDSCKDNLYETFYLLPISMEVGNLEDKGLDGLEVGSNEYIKKSFTKERLGDKEYYTENPPINGDKDYVYVAEDKVEEFVYDKIKNEWVSNGKKVVGGVGKSTGVEIKNVDVPNVRIEGDYRITENVPYEKVVCNENLIGQDIFVVNENTKLGEIFYVAKTKNDARSKIDNGFVANNICTTNIKDMSQMFEYSEFNQPLNRWDVSNVNNMGYMFEGNNSFNQDLNSWDVSNVEDMSFMFVYAMKFNGDISTWATSKVVNMNQMFSGAMEFNGDISAWDTSIVTFMGGMFVLTPSFNQNLSSWNVSNVENMQDMFYRASSFNQDISNWNISNVENMNFMFEKATSFNQNLSNWIICDKNFKDYDKGATSWQTSNKPKTTCEVEIMVKEVFFDLIINVEEHPTFYSIIGEVTMSEILPYDVDVIVSGRILTIPSGEKNIISLVEQINKSDIIYGEMRVLYGLQDISEPEDSKFKHISPFKMYDIILGLNYYYFD